MPRNNIQGVAEFQRLLEQAGRVPAKALTQATKKAANIVRNQAKTDAPKETGLLKRSLKLKSEKRKTGKKVYRIGFFAEGLVKFSSTGKRSFYPASQEYGWIDRNGRHHPGKRFFRNAVDSNRRLIEETIVRELINSLREVT